MTCLRKLLYFFINKNQFIKLNSSNKSDYIVEKLKKVALTLLFPISTNMFLIQNTSELVNQMSLFQKDYSSATGSFRNFVS